jgi:hypothetical protein
VLFVFEVLQEASLYAAVVAHDATTRRGPNVCLAAGHVLQQHFVRAHRVHQASGVQLVSQGLLVEVVLVAARTRKLHRTYQHLVWGSSASVVSVSIQVVRSRSQRVHWLGSHRMVQLADIRYVGFLDGLWRVDQVHADDSLGTSSDISSVGLKARRLDWRGELVLIERLGNHFFNPGAHLA